MTKEQGEALQIWCIKTIAKHNLNYFRVSVLVEVVEYISVGGSYRLMRAISVCRAAIRLGFEPDQKDYTELLRELREIAKEVPLSDTAQSVITYIFGGEWEESIHAIFKLKRERNEQN